MDKKVTYTAKVEKTPEKIVRFSVKSVFDYVCKNDVKNILFIFITDKNDFVPEFVKKSTRLVSRLKGVLVDFYQVTDQYLAVKFDEDYDLVILADDYRVYNFARLNFDKAKVITLNSNVTNITYALSNLAFTQNSKVKVNVLDVQFSILNKFRTNFNPEFYGFVAYAINECLKKLVKSAKTDEEVLEVFNFFNTYVETFIANNHTNLIPCDVCKKMKRCLQLFFQFQNKETTVSVDKVCSLPELYYQYGINGDKFASSLLGAKSTSNSVNKEKTLKNLKLIKEKILYFEKLAQETNSAKEEKHA